uniref:Uncharacterized protein n=1 Tax=Globodera rostochiensis TaxID=31243 RepID=A0A914I9M2_GLORO
MFLLHRQMSLLLPLFALCFAAPPSNYGTSVKLEGISTEKNGLSVTYRTFNKTEKDDGFVFPNINDSEVARNDSASTNNATDVDHCSVLCKKGAFRTGCVLAVVFMLLVVILLLFVLDRLYRRDFKEHIYISA